MYERVNQKVPGDRKPEQYKRVLEDIYLGKGQAVDSSDFDYFSSDVNTTWDAGGSVIKDSFNPDYDGPDGKDTERKLVQEVANNPEVGGVRPASLDENMDRALERHKQEQAQKEALTVEQKKKEVEDSLKKFESGNKVALNKKSDRLEKRTDVSSTSRLAESQHFGQENLKGDALVQKQDHMNQMWNESPQNLEGQLLSVQENTKTQETQDMQPKQEIPLDAAAQGVLADLGFSYEDLVQRVPDFAYMTEGQRAYILYKAEQQSVEHMQTNANNLFQQKTQESGWFVRTFRKGALRREATREIASSHAGLDMYAGDIAHLTKHVQDSELPIHLTEHGEYVIEYQKMPDGVDTKDPNYMRLNNYNRAATVLSDVPYEWSLSTASKKERKAFDAALKEFEKYEYNVTEIYKNAKNENGELMYDHGSVMMHMHKLRSSVEHNQYFSTYPDVEKRIDEMQNSSWWSEMKGKLANPATVGLALGAGGRMLSKSLYGLGGAAGASAIIGGIMGWRKKKGEFIEDAKQIRKKDLSIDPQLLEQAKSKDKKYIKLNEEAQKLGLLTLSSAGNWEEFQKLKSSLSKKDVENLDKLVDAMYVQQEYLTNKILGVKNTTHKVFESDKNATRIYKLLNQLEKEQDPVRKQRTLTALEDRLMLLDDRLKDGRVNFGKTKDQLKNKQELVAAMAAAHEYRFSMTQEAKQVQDRVLQYFDAQDSQTQKTRNKEMAKAVAVGAGLGTVTAVAGWFISDYFANDSAGAKKMWGNIVGKDEQLATPPGSIPEIGKVPIESPSWKGFPGAGAGKEAWDAMDTTKNLTDFDVSVDASSRGAIATFADLQEQLQAKYPDMTQAPEYVQEFMSKTPTELAIEENMYRPTDVSGDESAKIYKGGKLGFNKAGQLVYTDARTGTDILSGEGRFDGDHFDYGARQAAQAKAENAIQTDAWKNTIDKMYEQNAGRPLDSNGKPIQYRPGAFDNGVVVNDRPMTFAEEAQVRSAREAAEASANIFTNEIPDSGNVEMFKGFNIDYVVGENKSGKPEFKFKNVDFSKFNAYHSAYFPQNTSIDSYARQLYFAKGFQEQNSQVSLEKLKNEISNIANEIILRDQMMSSGNFPQGSEEYILLKKERGILLSYLDNKSGEYLGDVKLFESLNDSVKKNPDFNSLVNNQSTDTGPAVYTNPDVQNLAQETVETQDPQLSIKRLENIPSETFVTSTLDNVYTDHVKGGDFSISKTPNGDIAAIKYSGNIDTRSVDLKSYGFNENWRSDSGFSQTFKDSVQGKQVEYKIQQIKQLIAQQEAFVSGTKEYDFLTKQIQGQIKSLDTQYPDMFQ